MHNKVTLKKSAKKIFLLVLSLALLSGPVANLSSLRTANNSTHHEAHAATTACTGHSLGKFNGSPACVDASGKLHICENNFPDTHFMTWLSDSANVPHATSDYFTASEVNSVTSLIINSKNITDLSGIEFFTDLTELNCSNNRLTTLNLPSNSKLSVLKVGAQTSTATKYLDDGTWKVDLNAVVGTDNLANIAVPDIDNGTYDKGTGIVTYNSEPNSIKYNYTIGGIKSSELNPVTMDVTLTLAEDFEQWIEVNDLWFGIHAESDVFQPDSQFHVNVLKKGSDEYAARLAMFDTNLKAKVEGENVLLFDIGVTKPDGTEYSTLNGTADIYIEQPSGWDYQEMQAVLITQFQDAQFEESFVQINPNDSNNTQTSYDDDADVEANPNNDGDLNFIKFTVNHFSPFAVYDELTTWDYAEHYAWIGGVLVLAIGAAVLIYLKVRKRIQ